MNFNFGEILTKSWQIIWKHKVLWIFGVLAGCGRGGGGNGGGGGNSGTDFSGPSTQFPPQVQSFFEAVAENAMTYVAIFIALICVIWIVVIFLSTIGKIGLIRGVFQAEGGAEKLIFGELFSGSIPYFWRVLGLNLILGLPVFLFALVVAVFAVFVVVGMVGGSGNEPLAALGIIPFVIGCTCLLVPVMLVLGLIFRQAERAIVLEELAVMPSLSRGWGIFRANLGPIILMAIILGIMGLVVGLIIAIPVFLVVFPAVFTFALSEGQSFTPLIFMGICMCIYIPIALVLQGILTSYTESAWTLTFMNLTRTPGPDNEPMMPEDDHPIEPEDSNKTIIATRPHA